MHSYVRNQYIARYRKLIAIGEGDRSRDEVRYHMLLQLLTEELAKDIGQETENRLPDA
jgi:hypothetical protein